MVRVVVVLSLAGCGRLGFTDHAPLDGTTADTSHDGAADATLDALIDARPDAAALGPCTPLALTDDFNDGTRAATWTLLANNPVTVAETGGQLEVTLSTSGGSHYGGYDSATTYDLRNHCMYVSFTTTPTAETSVEMQFTARTAAGAFGWVYHQAVIDPYVNAGTFTSQGAVTYDPVAHKILRLREDAGTVTWETSADGTTYVPLVSTATPFDVSAITIALESGTFASAASPGIARYDNFDTP